MEKEITLLEALTGLEFVLTHLDGKKYRIKSNAGEIVKHDDMKTVEHLGMPLSKRTYTFGNLFIHFTVKFPTKLDPKNVALVQEALKGTGAASGSGSTKNGRKKSGAGAEDSKEDVDETVQMQAFDEAHKNTHHGGGTAGNDSEEDEDDEEHSHGGQRVGC